MIQLSRAQIENFKGLIGAKLEMLSSSRLAIHEDMVLSQTCALVVTIKLLYKTEKLLLRADFFENESGDVYYDYDITKDFQTNDYSNAEVYLKTSPITEIQIYGRIFNNSEFIEYPEIYEKFKGLGQTDDVFLLKCKASEEIMIVFHPFLPQIEVLYNPKTINSFWNEYKDDYQMHYTYKSQ